MKKQKQNAATAAIESLLAKNTPVPLFSPVEPDALMNDLIHEIKRYVVVSDHSAFAVALWVILTWCYDLFPRCPLLLINAPERECGKTQLLKVVEFLVHKPLETTNITLAALFRVVSNHAPTLLIDEADTFMDGKGELAGIVNKGYERGGVVIRIESDGTDFGERIYFVFGPKAMAGITLERFITSATMSRGIQVPMKRKAKEDKVERLRSANPQVFADLRSRISRFVKDHQEVLAQGWSDLPSQLSDRQQDNWEPLLTIAHCLGPTWYSRAIEAALAVSVETAQPKSSSNQLLEDIREVLQRYSKKYIPSATLLEMLSNNGDMDWGRYNRGEPMTSRQLSRYMAAYGIKSKTVRMDEKYTPKGYEVREFEDAFDRYLEPLSGDEEKTPEMKEVSLIERPIVNPSLSVQLLPDGGGQLEVDDNNEPYGEEF